MKLLIVALVAGCSVPSLDLNGKGCPCPSPYVCNLATQTCAATVADAHVVGLDGKLYLDAAVFSDGASASCLNAALSHPIYTSPTFNNFAADFANVGGTWVETVGVELNQTNAAVQLSYVHHSVGNATGNYRVVAAMRQVGNGNAGGALEIAVRIDATKSNMYHCNFEPNDGFFLIQHTDNAVGGGTLTQTNVAVPDPHGTYILEFQVINSNLECCVDGIPAAHVTVSDLLYAAGQVGVKTYEMAAAFTGFAVYD